ncbi:putative ankyrin repeat protein RF_0381 [Mytilus californianus]|uniref:putative ankyrin repeat protein RF_0381 n=1 Tax=Mytilus californianus TaxID=6549 RepID=UPI00224781D0|nr:putative ankyrin repeat protein RF_0381 [Mytilus californianus]
MTLHKACLKGNEDMVKVLCKFGALTNQSSNNGFSPLHFACDIGHTKITEILIQTGVAIDKVHESGQTPLQCACDNMHNEIAKLLLDSGAVENSSDTHGRTSLHSAAEDGNTDLIKLLIDHNADVNLTCNYRHNEKANVLLENSADVNDHDEDGRTSLFSAAENGNIVHIKILIEHDADVNFQKIME